MVREELASLLSGQFFCSPSPHSAPVAKISSRGHIPAALFLCLTVLWYTLPRRRLTVILRCASNVLALGSKETAIAAPALLLLSELVVHRAALRRERIMERKRKWEVFK